MINRENAYESWKRRYELGWARKDQLQMVVKLKLLTEDEYEKITGEEFKKHK